MKAEGTKETIPWWQVNLGDEAANAAFSAVTNKSLSQGKITKELESTFADLVDSRHAIVTSSGSTALTLSLIALGAKPGDRVICPAYTWIATAHAAHLLGCVVELVDIEENKPVMDVSKLPHVLDQKVYALPVHMNGHATDVPSLIAKGYTVIEDAAQALGSESAGSMLGTLGAMGCFSFSVSKIIGSGQGGMIITNSDELADSARKARTHGVIDVFAPEVWQGAGHNFRYNDVLAAILLTQIPKLSERLVHARKLVEAYSEGLSKTQWIEIVSHSHSSEIGPYIEARVSSEIRDPLVTFLSERGVGARKAFPSLSKASYLHIDPGESFPNAEKWSSEVLYLPSGPGLKLNEVGLIVDCITGYIADN
jgi:dTDP-4-amino-4,6-dideoxygalactose transaminase